MALSAPGIGSNLDVNSIVEQLIQFESRPLLLLDSREASFHARISSLGTLKGALASLQSAAQGLAGAATAAFKATSSNTGAVTASASSTAVAGTYTVSVTQLAQSQKLVAAGQVDAAAAIGGGSDTTLTFSFGTISGGSLAGGVYSGASFTADPAATPFTVTVGATDNTLEGIRDAINAAGQGVSASIVNDGSGTPYRLALSVAATGAARSLKIEVSGEAAIDALLAYDPAGAQQLAQTQAAQNALFTVDGVPIEKTSNTVSDAIGGVTLGLAQTTATPVTIGVARDQSAASAAISAFVKAYNDFNSGVASVTAKGATLQGDSAVLSVQRRVRAAIGTGYGALGEYRTLSSLGLSFQRDGVLYFDSSKLAGALAADTAGALATLALAGPALEAVGKSGQQAVDAGTAAANLAIDSLNDRRDAIGRRLELAEQRYRLQFAALDAMLGRMSQTSAFLTQQLALLPNPANNGSS